MVRSAGRTWVSLFSGGKDSSFALYLAQQRGLPVEIAVTALPQGDSYMYHVPGIDLAGLAAESIGIEHRSFPMTPPTEGSASNRGDKEIQPLEEVLAELDQELGIAGVVAGAVESEFQASRIEAMCDRLDMELFAPLWQQHPERLAEEMLAAGFEITIVQVSAAGLDASWLGRRLDGQTLTDLKRLADEYGIHILGEGGEFETIVTDGPHMDRPLQFSSTTEWDGTRGHLTITDAWLADHP